MNLPNKFAHIFPSDECDLRDAAEALVDEIEGYSHDGLFLHAEFVQCFAKKIIHIIEKMPQHQKRGEIEEELAYIFRYIRERHQLILIEGALVPAESADAMNTSPLPAPGMADVNRDAMQKFVYGHLRHMREQAEHDLGSFIRYLSLIREYSQQGVFAMCGIEDHIEDATWNYSYQELEDMIQSYDYGVTADHSLNDWERDIMKEWDLGRELAAMIIWQEQMIYARYHGFLADIAAISSRLIQENRPLYAMYENMLPSLLNDVRDILDPEQNIPIFFLEKDELVNQIREGHSMSPSFH